MMWPSCLIGSETLEEACERVNREGGINVSSAPSGMAIGAVGCAAGYVVEGGLGEAMRKESSPRCDLWICECGNHNTEPMCARCQNGKAETTPSADVVQSLAEQAQMASRRFDDEPLQWHKLSENDQKRWREVASTLWTVQGFDRYSLRMAKIEIADLKDKLRRAGL